MGGDRVYFNQMLLYFNTVLPLGDFFFFFLVTCSLFSGSLGTRIKSKGSVDKGGPFSSSSKKRSLGTSTTPSLVPVLRRRNGVTDLKPQRKRRNIHWALVGGFKNSLEQNTSQAGHKLNAGASALLPAAGAAGFHTGALSLVLLPLTLSRRGKLRA